MIYSEMSSATELLGVACFLVLAQAWLSCLTINCGNLGENICAQVGTENAISLRSTACNEDFSCSYNDIIKWYTQDATTRNNILMCTAMPIIAVGEAWPCANRQARKNLVSGSYPKACLTDQDCELQDGTFNSCVCAPRSTSASGYCKPDISSTHFEDYWTLCTQTANKITDANLGYYWYLRTQFAVYYDVADLPACSTVLWEFVQFSNVQADIAGAAVLLLSVFGLF